MPSNACAYIQYKHIQRLRCSQTNMKKPRTCQTQTYQFDDDDGGGSWARMTIIVFDVHFVAVSLLFKHIEPIRLNKFIDLYF